MDAIDYAQYDNNAIKNVPPTVSSKTYNKLEFTSTTL